MEGKQGEFKTSVEEIKEWLSEVDEKLCELDALTEDHPREKQIAELKVRISTNKTCLTITSNESTLVFCLLLSMIIL